MTNLRDALRGIYEEHGYLTPGLLVALAANEEHPLHGKFTWDDAVAGHRYRLDQAQRLIQRVRVHVTYGETHTASIREWLSVERVNQGPTYEPVDEVAEDEFALRIVLQAMERDIAALQRKYGHLQEFLPALRRAAGL